MITMIGDFVLDKLNKNCVDEINLYENALYRAFSNTYIKTLDKIWKIDHNTKRIQTIVPYDDQEVLILKSSTKIYAAIAANFSKTDRQFEIMGFHVEEVERISCEILHIFNLLDSSFGRFVLETISKEIYDEIRRRGLSVIYSTCSKKRLAQYTESGFKVIQEKLFFNEEKYFLKNVIEDKGDYMNEK